MEDPFLTLVANEDTRVLVDQAQEGLSISAFSSTRWPTSCYGEVVQAAGRKAVDSSVVCRTWSGRVLRSHKSGRI